MSGDVREDPAAKDGAAAAAAAVEATDGIKASADAVGVFVEVDEDAAAEPSMADQGKLTGGVGDTYFLLARGATSLT